MSEPPIIKPLRADHLTVDSRVQRSIDPVRVRKLAETFDRSAIGTIIVSARADGSFHIVDGQTRVAAMKELGLGDETVACLVHEELTLAEEAALFRLHNDTKQVKPVMKFMIRVVEGEPKATELINVLTRHGWTVNGTTHRGCFSAVAALEWIYDGANAYEPKNIQACDVVVSVLTLAFGLNPDGMRNELVRGLGLVVLRYGDQLDVRKLTVDLAKHDGGPLGVIGDARTLRKVRSDTIANAMAEVLVGIQNKGRRTRKIPEWRDRQRPTDAS